MQKNASLLAIVAVHTAENEPSKVGDECAAEQSAPSKLALFEQAPERYVDLYPTSIPECRRIYNGM